MIITYTDDFAIIYTPRFCDPVEIAMAEYDEYDADSPFPAGSDANTDHIINRHLTACAYILSVRAEIEEGRENQRQMVAETAARRAAEAHAAYAAKHGEWAADLAL